MSPYGVTKLTAEHYLFYYANVHGLEYAAMRYSNVYGPRQDPHGEAGVVAIFCNRIIAGTPIRIFGDGAQTRDYVYVGDVVQANMLASDVALPAAESIDSRAFNVGTGIETSVNQLADEMMAAVGASIPKDYAAARPGEVQNSALDAGKLRALGWAPRQTLRDGLAATYAHIAAQGVPA
jgi:UDP-glucose 4-epimerase